VRERPSSKKKKKIAGQGIEVREEEQWGQIRDGGDSREESIKVIKKKNSIQDGATAPSKSEMGGEEPAV